MCDPVVGILGMGHRLPARIRRNDDPIFDWLHENHPPGVDLFTGFETRHVLDDGESVVDILTPAARIAMDDAGLGPGDIDHVVGCVSPGAYIVPESLFDLTRRLGLPETTLTVPFANDFSNFNVAVVFADALVRAGRARNVLVAVGGGWSRAVSYTTAQAISAADGAAAAVVGAAQPRWTVVDSDVIAREMKFGEMGLFANPVGEATPGEPGVPVSDPTRQRFTGPYFQITHAGLQDFSDFGGKIAPQAALRLMQRQGIDPKDVTFTGHQASAALFAFWEKALAPATLFQTLKSFGNMTVANIAVNLCLIDATQTVTTPYVLALALAPDMHAHALLLRRGVW
jgi:3-oxoacyl-[acyl-carrier-protein] synthase-3